MGIIMKDGQQYGIGGTIRAENVSYDNTDSGMTATNVQEAVDELNAGLTVEDITSDFSPQSHIVTFYAFKCGKRISICFQGDTHGSSTDISIVTIPSQYRPTTVRWYGSSMGLSNKPRTTYISNDYVVHSASSETTGWYAGTLEWYMQ